jgi:hypothetical protein
VKAVACWTLRLAPASPAREPISSRTLATSPLTERVAPEAMVTAAVSPMAPWLPEAGRASTPAPVLASSSVPAVTVTLPVKVFCVVPPI